MVRHVPVIGLYNSALTHGTGWVIGIVCSSCGEDSDRSEGA